MKKGVGWLWANFASLVCHTVVSLLLTLNCFASTAVIELVPSLYGDHLSVKRLGDSGTV